MISKTALKVIYVLPKPIVRIVAKLVLNRYIAKYAKVTVINKEKLKQLKKPAIFVCNHLSNSDGLVLDKVLGEGRVWFVAGIKLAQNELTKLGLDVVKTIPINPSAPDKSALSKVVRKLKSGHSVCIFPEGTRSRRGSLMHGKKGILLIARLSGVPIVPMGIEGTEKLMPINDQDMGSEEFFHANVRVTIGDSFYIPEKEAEEIKEEYEHRTLELIMKKIAELLSPQYRGVYGEQ